MCNECFGDFYQIQYIVEQILQIIKVSRKCSENFDARPASVVSWNFRYTSKRPLPHDTPTSHAHLPRSPATPSCHTLRPRPPASPSSHALLPHSKATSSSHAHWPRPPATSSSHALLPRPPAKPTGEGGRTRYGHSMGLGNFAI